MRCPCESPRRSVFGASTVLLVAGVVVALLAGACAGPSPEQARDAVIYETVVRWLLENEVAPPAEDGELAVYIESLGTESFSLEVEVEMVELFSDDDVRIRFIDDREEAVDEDTPPYAVEDGGALIGLGPLTVDRPISLRAELYTDANNIKAYRFQLSGSGSSWRVAAPPEQVPVEELKTDVDPD